MLTPGIVRSSSAKFADGAVSIVALVMTLIVGRRVDQLLLGLRAGDDDGVLELRRLFRLLRGRRGRRRRLGRRLRQRAAGPAACGAACADSTERGNHRDGDDNTAHGIHRHSCEVDRALGYITAPRKL